MAIKFFNSIDVGGEVKCTSLDVNGTAQFDGAVNVGADDAGNDVKFFGATSGANFLYDQSEDGVVITHPTDETGLGIYTISGGQPTVPQLQIGRSTAQYWGAYTDDRIAHLVHRQDETSGALSTYFEQWDSNTSDTTGNWLWRFGDGSGGNMATALTLTQGGDLTLVGDIYHSGDSDTKIGFSAANTFEVQTGGSARLTVNDSTATFAGIVSVPTGKSFRLYNAAGNGWGELNLNETANKIQFNRGIQPSGDNQSDQLLGTASKRWHTVNAGAIVATGEVQGGSLDINGNADISGNLTGVDTLTATTFSGDLNGTINTATTATTQSASNNSTKVATTAYVDAQVATVVDSAPGTLNTLNELAAALGDDASFSTTVTNSIATKLPLAGGTMSGAIAMGSQNITGVASLTAQGISASSAVTANTIQLQGDLNVLNKAQSSYLTLADRDTSGSEVVYNLDNIGTLTASGKILATVNSGTNFEARKGGGTGAVGFGGTAHQTGLIEGVDGGGLKLYTAGNDVDWGGSWTLNTTWSGTQLTVAGELEAGSLDINGNADISGNLTGVDDLTMSGNLDCADVDASGTITGDGSGIDTINASNISSGTLAAARVATLNQNTTGSSGSCTGNAATATTATNVTALSVSNSADYFGCFVSSTGTQGIKVANGLKYNPSTNVLTAGKISSDTVSIVENAKTDAACMTITGAGSGNEANIALKVQGTAHGDPVKLKMKGEDAEGGEVGKGLLSFDPVSDTFSIGQSSSHNSMAIKIDNSDVAIFKNMAQFPAGIDITGTTDATNATGDTGILRCEGGASIAKKLYVGSTITGSADVIAYSDERLKKNVKTLDGKKVLEMRGVSFERTDSGKQSSGVIAQELEKVAPELVIDDGSYKGVAYGNVVGYLIEAIKDQQKQIDELKAMCNGCSK